MGGELKNNNLFKIAEEIEKQAMQDEYYKKRSLYPNLDYYSGLLM